MYLVKTDLTTARSWRETLSFRKAVMRHRLFLLLIPTLLLASCRDEAIQLGEAQAEPPAMTELALTVTGYNYTNRSINDFTVDGASGGNLHVSSPNSGGGGSVCCSPYVVGAGARKVKIRWAADACTYDNRKDRTGQLLYVVHYFYKEVTVDIAPNVPRVPRILEVHFYEDGHVEAAMTEIPSPPRLRLDDKRAAIEPYKQCPDDKRPEQ